MKGFTALTKSELDALSVSGSVLSRALKAVVNAVRAGVSTKELDLIADHEIKSAGAVPSFLGYNGYPASLCVSINDEVVHGIPKKERVLHDGDVVGLDLGASYKGIHTDMATTVYVGKHIFPDVLRLLTTTRNALDAALAMLRPGITTGDIGSAVQHIVESDGFSVVRELVGHGVGRSIHEEPAIPNFGSAGSGERIVEGMVLAIEPMVTEGGYAVVTDSDGWTVRTKDGTRAAHEERTVLVSRNGCRIVTPWNHG
ncbi:MAG: type I methionyl aminopeptidase [Candidatus Kerfeldbacteria bacterium]